MEHLGTKTAAKPVLRIMLILGILAQIIALNACGGGGGGCWGDDCLLDGDGALNGTWKSADGNELKLSGRSFEYSENGKAAMKGTYEYSENSRAAMKEAYAAGNGRSVSGSIAMEVTELHGDFLSEIEEEGPDFKSEWYTKNKVTEAFREWIEDEYPFLTENEVSGFLDRRADDIDDMFPTIEGEYTLDGNNYSMTLGGETFAKQGGSGGGGGPGPGGSADGPALAISGLPAGNDYVVYVFPMSADLSNFMSVMTEIANQSKIVAAGAREAGTPDSFTMIIWDETWLGDALNGKTPDNVTFWHGSGAYQVVLVLAPDPDSAGAGFDPFGMYRKANINFSNGSAASRYSDFAELDFGF